MFVFEMENDGFATGVAEYFSFLFKKTIEHSLLDSQNNSFCCCNKTEIFLYPMNTAYIKIFI